MRIITHRAAFRRTLIAAATLPVLSLALACAADSTGPSDPTSSLPAPATPDAPSTPGAPATSALMPGTGTPSALRSRLADNLCMDVQGASTAPGAKVTTWSCNGGKNQQFAWQSNGEIRVYGTMCLDASGGQGKDGDPIIIWNCNGGAHQKWSASAAGEIKGINGKCIDVTASNKTPGTPLILWTCHGTANEKWDNTSGPTTPTSPNPDPSTPTPAPTPGTPSGPTTPGQPSGSTGASVDFSRQPSGMTLIADRAFNSRATSSSDTRGAEGWGADLESRSPYINVMKDATAPRDGTVWQLTYPKGQPINPADSFSPVHAWMSVGARPRTVYVSFWFKTSSNWVQHPGGETKLVELIIANQSRLVLSLTGQGTAPPTPVVRVNGGPDSRAGGYLKQNVSSRGFTHGVWHRYEAILTANTPGVANGGARWWLDGVELGNYNDVKWTAAGESTNWTQLDLNPIWGGRNGQLSQTQYMWIDHLYASGK